MPPEVETTLSAPAVRGWLRDLDRLSAANDGDRIDALRALEELKAAAAAAQARITVEFDESQRRQQCEAGVRQRDLGKGIGAQVGLARRESAHKGARLVGLAHALVEELPRTFDALRRGHTTEWRATIVARETACLSHEDRMAADSELAAQGLERLGDAATEAEARRIAYRLDPRAFTARASKAESERRVSLRPAPDTMTHLTGLLPVRQGVAVHAALSGLADTLRAGGDARSRGQIMADTLVERVTGQTTAEAVPLEVQVVMTADALIEGDAEPALVEGHGPVPAPLARSWIRETAANVWVRRLYTSPFDGSLVAMDSRRRCFEGRLRRFVVARDGVCRTPWCNGPVRHVDHVVRAADGGSTSAVNGQGLCEACNQAKEAVGWRARGSGRAVETTTPTGHRYRSRPPALAPPVLPRGPSAMEAHFRDTVILIA